MTTIAESSKEALRHSIHLTQQPMLLSYTHRRRLTNISSTITSKLSEKRFIIIRPKKDVYGYIRPRLLTSPAPWRQVSTSLPAPPHVDRLDLPHILTNLDSIIHVLLPTTQYRLSSHSDVSRDSNGGK